MWGRGKLGGWNGTARVNDGGTLDLPRDGIEAAEVSAHGGVVGLRGLDFHGAEFPGVFHGQIDFQTVGGAEEMEGRIADGVATGLHGFHPIESPIFNRMA